VFGAPESESGALGMTESVLRTLAERGIVELDDGD
jgi:hypothetical protein